MSLQAILIQKLRTIKYLKQEKGAVFVLTAILLPMLFGFMGIAYDVGNLYSHKAKLQNTADAAALAGARAYVNELKRLNPQVTTPPSDTDKSAAEAYLKNGANQFITNNNPFFNEKASSNSNLKNFAIGSETKSSRDEANKKTTDVLTEYFRVTLSEPVDLYFLTFLPGMPKSADVKVYATAKLSETTTVTTDGDPNSVQEVNYKPTIIAANTFNDEINTGYPSHQLYNYYEGEVYAVNGETSVSGVSNGSGGTVIYNRDGTAALVNTTENYDMLEFGEEVKKLFRSKQKSTLQGADLAKFEEYEAKRTQWDNGYKEYLPKFKDWLTEVPVSYTAPIDDTDILSIYNYFSKYLRMFDPYNDPGQALAKRLKKQWEADGNPLVGDFEALTNILTNYFYLKNYWDPTYIPNGSNFNTLKDVEPYKSLFVVLRNEKRAPNVSIYTHLDKEPDAYADYGIDEYYMTYHMYFGGRTDAWGKSLSTYEISKDATLSGKEHSYFYLPRNAIKDGNITITVDGFYPNPNKEDGTEVTYTDGGQTKKITQNTPFYLFIDEGIDQSISVTFTEDCNRPLVFCYLGTIRTYYDFKANNVKGFLYAPNNVADTHINNAGTQNTTGIVNSFSGTIITSGIEIKTHGLLLKYNSEEVETWKQSEDNPEGLTFTPNIGFESSNNNNNSQSTTVATWKWPEKLKLALRGQQKSESHYVNADVTWRTLP